MTSQDLARNALYSQAVADAIGNPFEFGNPSKQEVLSYMGGTDQLRITDDTQMAMFGLEAVTESALSEYSDLEDRVTKAYQKWLHTQEHKKVVKGATGLLAEETMYRVEAPGMTCLSALRDLKAGTPHHNDSKGCGCVMRLLPFALIQPRIGLDAAQSIARFSGAVTHHHEEVPAAIDLYMGAATEMMEHGALRHRPELTTATAITDFGTGWTAMGCVQMAMWAVYQAEDFDEMLTLSICHEGDSDSVAAVAGSLWGLGGRTGWEKYADRLEQKGAIERLLTS